MNSGSIQPLPFIQNSQAILTTINGLNTTNLAYNFIASDLQSARLVKIVQARFDFAPAVTGNFILVQIMIEDPSTNILVPVTRQRSLNQTTRTSLIATFPVQPLGYSHAGSGGTAMAIRVLATGISSIQYTLEAKFIVARDNV